MPSRSPSAGIRRASSFVNRNDQPIEGKVATAGPAHRAGRFCGMYWQAAPSEAHQKGPQQISLLFDHLVGGNEHRRRHSPALSRLVRSRTTQLGLK
jgi:hypothetical protein